jgi:N-acyl homoserine lactone hydrolase
MASPVTPCAHVERLEAFTGGGEGCMRTIFDPWAPDCAETVFLPYRFYALQHSEGWVLVDCGAHPDLARDPRSRLGDQTEFSSVVMAEEDDVLHKIGQLGLGADDIAHVIVTHLHYDHCGGLALLPRAAVHIQAAELEFASHPPVYQALSYIAKDWETVQNWAPHAGRFDLFGDGAIVGFPTPGHTAGHQSVEITLPSGCAILVGDAAFRPQEMAARKLPAYLWNPDALLESWDLLEERREKRSAELLFSHYPLLEQ